MTTTRPTPVTFELSDIDAAAAVDACDRVTRALVDLGCATEVYVTDDPEGDDDGAAGEFVVPDAATREVVVLATRALLTLATATHTHARVTVA